MVARDGDGRGAHQHASPEPRLPRLPEPPQAPPDGGRPVNTAEALLAAVREQPDDDLPRLAYADWLEEHGDAPRAKLIRLQVERARLPEGDSKGAKLKRRENVLLKAHPEWEQTSLGVAGALHRGFIEE